MEPAQPGQSVFWLKTSGAVSLVEDLEMQSLLKPLGGVHEVSKTIQEFGR